MCPPKEVSGLKQSVFIANNLCSLQILLTAVSGLEIMVGHCLTKASCESTCKKSPLLLNEKYYIFFIQTTQLRNLYSRLYPEKRAIVRAHAKRFTLA